MPSHSTSFAFYLSDDTPLSIVHDQYVVNYSAYDGHASLLLEAKDDSMNVSPLALSFLADEPSQLNFPPTQEPLKFVRAEYWVLREQTAAPRNYSSLAVPVLQGLA